MAMKISFVIPPEQHFIESYVTKKLSKNREFRPKLGLLYVAGYLKKHGACTPGIIDCLAEGYDIQDLERIIQLEQPDIVGFSVLTFNLLDCLSAAKAIKRVSPDTKICFGGYHVTLYPKESLNLPNVDYVVFGEGEITFTELVKYHRAFQAGKNNLEDLKSIEGIGWIDEQGNQVLNSSRKNLDNLDELPYPAHDLIDLKKYTVVLGEQSAVASIQTSRGCPAKCTFCDIRLTRFRYRSEENVVAEIKWLLSLGMKEFFFLDDTFTINRNRALRLCKLLIKENLGIKYKISSRIDKVDEELLSYLAKSGCYRIHYGVESGSQRVLDYLQKEISIDQVHEVMNLTKKVNIQIFVYMMIGVPTETKEEMLKSVELINKVQPDHVNYSICSPFPKTYLYEQALTESQIKDDYWQNFADNPDSSFKIKTLNKDFDEVELRRMQDFAMRQFYMSPRLIFREIRRTRGLKQLITKAKLGGRLLFPRIFY